MLSSEQRNWRLIFRDPHYLQALKERSNLFNDGKDWKDHHKECKEAVRNPLKGIFIEDKREDATSNYSCIFVNECGEVVCLPCVVKNGIIIIITLKGVRNDYNNPNWCVRPYNEIAKTRGMETLSFVFRG